MSDTLYDVLEGLSVDRQKIIALPNAEIRRTVVELVGYFIVKGCSRCQGKKSVGYVVERA